MSEIVGITRECAHGYQGIHCTLDHKGSHPGPLMEQDACYCGEAAWLPIEDAEAALREAGYAKIGTVEETWTITDEVDEMDLLAQGYVSLTDVKAALGLAVDSERIHYSDADWIFATLTSASDA